jgi:multifunctional beta-oxidation protein
VEGDHYVWYVDDLTSETQYLTVDDRATNPSSGHEALEQILSNFSNLAGDNSSSGSSGSTDAFIDAEDTEEIKKAKRNPPKPDEYTYTERDVLLYNLGIGAKADELHWTYENADGFEVRSDRPRRIDEC